MAGFLPAPGPIHGLVPARKAAGPLAGIHLGQEGPLRGVEGFQLPIGGPETHAPACQHGRAQGGGFGIAGPQQGHAQQVGLELHEQIVGAGAAVHPEQGDLAAVPLAGR